MNNCRDCQRDIISPSLYKEILNGEMPAKIPSPRCVVWLNSETSKGLKEAEKESQSGEWAPRFRGERSFQVVIEKAKSSLDFATQTTKPQKFKVAKLRSTTKKKARQTKNPNEKQPGFFKSQTKGKKPKRKGTEGFPGDQLPSRNPSTVQTPAKTPINEVVLKKRVINEPFEEPLVSTSSKIVNRTHGSPNGQEQVSWDCSKAPTDPIAFQNRSSTFQL